MFLNSPPTSTPLYNQTTNSNQLTPLTSSRSRSREHNISPLPSNNVLHKSTDGPLPQPIDEPLRNASHPSMVHATRQTNYHTNETRDKSNQTEILYQDLQSNPGYSTGYSHHDGQQLTHVDIQTDRHLSRDKQCPDPRSCVQQIIDGYNSVYGNMCQRIQMARQNVQVYNLLHGMSFHG